MTDIKSLQCSKGETRKFYHGTTIEAWEEIQAEGILWGASRVWENLIDESGNKFKKRLNLEKGDKASQPYRYTYLAPDIECAKLYGNIVLEVEYTPMGVGSLNENGEAIDNYGFNPPEGEFCGQFSVFQPIPISKITIYDK